MAGLRVERSGGIVTATLDRPEVRNALDRYLLRALHDLFVEVGERAADRVVVLTGAGRNFSSGGDLRPSEPPPSDPTETMAVVAAVARALHECPLPVIAAVDGVAAGAGASLAFGCDLVLASDTARFSLLFVRNGLSLDTGASWLLPRLVGMHVAKELALFGDWIDAPTAQRLGLVNRVVPTGDLAATAREWAERLCGQPATALTTIKRALQRASGVDLVEALEAEAADQARCASSPEFREVLERFRAR